MSILNQIHYHQTLNFANLMTLSMMSLETRYAMNNNDMALNKRNSRTLPHMSA